jgi:hypothetical protein
MLFGAVVWLDANSGGTKLGGFESRAMPFLSLLRAATGDVDASEYS